MSKNSRPTFRSKFEGSVYDDLIERNHLGFYESHKIRYVVPETYRTYTPDIVLDNGILIECKGWFPLKDRKKMVFVRSSNPTLDIRFVFMDADVKIRKNSPTTLGKWATNHNFMWARETIPESWVNEKETHRRTQEEVDHRIYFGSRYGPYSTWRE
jgi:hypothetical protein